jgi:hypothetical protein
MIIATVRTEYHRWVCYERLILFATERKEMEWSRRLML